MSNDGRAIRVGSQSACGDVAPRGAISRHRQAGRSETQFADALAGVGTSRSVSIIAKGTDAQRGQRSRYAINNFHFVPTSVCYRARMTTQDDLDIEHARLLKEHAELHAE